MSWILNRIPVTIPSGASVSAGIDLNSAALVRILMAPGWDAAALTFQVSMDGAVWYNYYDNAGAEVSVTTAAGRAVSLPRDAFVGFRYVIVRSGTNGTPVNQTADRLLTLITRYV